MSYINSVKLELGSHIVVEDELLDLYALLVLVKGAACTFEDVHDAWSVWKNRTNPVHKSLVSFDELDADVQLLDKEYAEAIIKTANMLDI